jgi:hypothetical protein
VSQDTFARIMGLAAVVFLIYALVLGLEAVLGRELLPGPGVFDHEVREEVPPVEMGREVERRPDRGAADHARKRPGPPDRTRPAGGQGGTDAGSLDEVASASDESAVADGLRPVERLLPVTRLPEQPLDVLGE